MNYAHKADLMTMCTAAPDERGQCDDFIFHPSRGCFHLRLGFHCDKKEIPNELKESVSAADYFLDCRYLVV